MLIPSHPEITDSFLVASVELGSPMQVPPREMKQNTSQLNKTISLLLKNAIDYN